ncbi:MAG: MFS transporter [Pseudomonadota bacterium]
MTTTASPDPRRWAVLAGVWMVYACFGLIAFSIAPLVPDISRELSLSATQMGTIMGAWQLVYIGAAIPGGMLLDRLSSRWTLLLGAALIAASALGRGLATDYWQLLLAVGLFGIGGPIISAGAPKVIADQFKGSERGLAMGIYMTGPTLGAVTALTLSRPLLLPYFTADWRPIMGLWAGTALAVGVLWFLLASSSAATRQHPRRTDADGNPGEGTLAVIGALLGDPTVRLVLLMAVAVFMFNHGLNNWLPEILAAKGIERAQAGYWASAPMMVGILASLTIPRLATPARRRTLLAVLCSLALLSSLLLLPAALPSTSAALLIQGVARSTLMTILILLLVELPAVGERRAGTASGLFFSCAEVGGVAGPVLIGVLNDQTDGFAAGLYALTLLCAGLFAASLRLRGQTD